MTATHRHERYEEVALREVKSGAVREPQWREALQATNGDLTAAGNFYVSTRVAEIANGEDEREHAHGRLHRIRAFNDSLAPSHGRFLLLCLVALATVIAFWFFMASSSNGKKPPRSVPVYYSPRY